MSENQPKSIGPRNETPPTPAQKVAYYTSLIAEDHDLDRLTYEALSKYANTSLKIREVITDFRGTTATAVKYPAYKDEDGANYKMIVPRSAYPDLIRNLSTIALNLYNTYLNNDSASRLAAREVQVIVNDVYPQSP